MTTPPPFDPIDFYNLAHDIATAPADEARLRAAIGRVYYALFLISRARTHPGRYKVKHIDVIAAVGKKTNLAAKSQLEAIQRLRHVADYEPTPANAGDANWGANWTRVSAIAARLLPQLQRMR